MKRAKEIDTKAFRYADHILARTARTGKLFTLWEDIYYAFVAGVNWADSHPKNVWHDASESPKAYNWEILCEDDSEMRWVANHFDAAGNWGYFARGKSLVRWAYISDLLPKGGEK